MSECPERTLEGLVWDTYGRHVGCLPESWPTKMLNPIIQDRLVAFYEPWREQIEYRMREYDEDESGSWRDYRGMVVWDGIPDPPESLFEGFKKEDGQYVCIT